MAVRTPLKLEAGELKEMSTTEIGAIIDQAMYLYGGAPSVTLSVANTGGTLGTISDTRFISGTALTSTTNFQPETSTSEPTIVTVNYTRMSDATSATTEPSDTANKAFPLYRDAAVGLRAMSVTDMYDTFINPAITKLANGADNPGTYKIHTATTLTGHTLVSATPVFVDTIADLAGMTSGEIGSSGTTQQDATTITNYYLFVTNQGSIQTYSAPMYVRSDGNIQQFDSTAFDVIMDGFIKNGAATGDGGLQLSYNLNGAGANKGSGMVDTRITSTTGDYQTRYVNTDDYRSQEFPAGTATAQTTTFLKITTI